MNATRAGTLLLLAALAAPGCGYGLIGKGGGTFLPDHVRIIALSPFENLTQRPEIEQRVTEEIARELAKRGRYRVVTNPSGADALLEGAVAQYRTSPVEFTPEGRATRIEAVVTIRATLRDLVSDRVLWNQAGLLFRRQYEVQETGGFTNEEDVAMDQIARDAAGALVSSIVEGF